MRTFISKSRKFCLVSAAVFLVAGFFGGAGCTPNHPAAESLLAPKSRPFKEVAQGVTELSIIHSATDTGGTPWTATFRKAGAVWKLDAGPGTPLLDRQAKTGFIEHVLDTVQTLQVNGPAPQGPPESFGLVPPLYALRWRNAEGASGEVQIGHQKTGPSAGYAILKIAGVTSPVAQVEGALYRMLETVTSFEQLRQQQVLAPWVADDVDEVEVSLRGKKLLYAQRAGTAWADAREKPLPRAKSLAVNELLQTLIHTQALGFVDDRAQDRRVVDQFKKAPEASVVLKDRRGNPLRVDLGWSQLEPGRDELLATTTGRLCEGEIPCAFVVHRRVLVAVQELGGYNKQR